MLGRLRLIWFGRFGLAGMAMKVWFVRFGLLGLVQ